MSLQNRQQAKKLTAVPAMRFRHLHVLLRALLWAIATTLSFYAVAEPSLQELVTGQRQSVEQNTSLGEEQKKQALTRLDETASLLQESSDLVARRDILSNQLMTAPQELEKLRKEMLEPGIGLKISDIEAWNLAQLEVVLNERQLKLGGLEKDHAASERELDSYLLLARTGSSEITQLQARLGSEDPPSQQGAKPAGLASVEQLWLQARRQQANSRLGLLSLQQNNLNLLIEISQMRRDLLASRLEGLRAHLAAFREYLQTRREKAATMVQLAAQQARLLAPTSLAKLQKRVEALAVEQRNLVAREAELDRAAEHAKRRAEEVKRDRARLEQIVELGGSSAQVSGLLQKRRTFTVPPKDFTQRLITYQQQLSDAALRQIELDEILRSSSDIDAELERLLASIAESERAEIYREAREALSRQREISLELWKQYTRIITRLSELEAATRQLLKETRIYRSFINDRLLWMPSADLVPLDQPELLFSATTWLLSPQNLAELSKDISKLPKEQGLKLFLWLASLLALVLLRGRALSGLKISAQAIQKPRSDRFVLTIYALASTLVLAMPLPWLFLGAGLLLGAQPDAHEYTLLTAAGLQAVGHTLLLLRLLRQLCRDQGVALSHLGWNEILCAQIEKQARWLSSAAPPLAFLGMVGSASVPSAFIQLRSVLQLDVAGLSAIGRIAGVALMLLIAISIYRVWHRKGAVMKAFAEDAESQKWLDYHLLWFYPAFLTPLLLAVTSLSGFYYTSSFLAGKAGETLWFIFLLMLFKDLLLRGLYSTQRRLRFEEALRYRESIRGRNAEEEEADPAPAEKAMELSLETGKHNYSELGEKVGQLVRMAYSIGVLTGLWWIWRDVIPAMNIFSTMDLPISTSKLVNGVSQEVPLTVGDMLTGLLFGGLALFAARNIPALLELTLLQRLPMSRASRYAFTTLTQYLVAMIGLVITFKALGLQWSSIQWLVAALSVGLGFGLQEIVANFVSGIILLFEQPIRVGDVVTVENTTGTVSRIRIRATTITNWDRQELVIPNKSFITGTLINWTLSDTLNRVIVTVGVSYDADTRKAMELMADVAREHPVVLEDPAPRITFEQFGDNSLNLLMRAYLNDIEPRLTTVTDLHQMILDRFREAGIVIAYPQRDLHLDTTRPLELVLRRDAMREAEGS